MANKYKNDPLKPESDLTKPEGDLLHVESDASKLGSSDPIKPPPSSEPGATSADSPSFHGDPLQPKGEGDDAKQYSGLAATRPEDLVETSAKTTGQHPDRKDGALNKDEGNTSGETTYKIAEGRGITTLRGILGEHERVTARDFAGGQKNLDELVAAGAVIKS